MTNSDLDNFILSAQYFKLDGISLMPNGPGQLKVLLKSIKKCFTELEQNQQIEEDAALVLDQMKLKIPR